MLGRLIKFLVALVVLGVIALAVYAGIGDLAPDPRDESLTVILDAE